jgi:hypothetical protein
MKRSAIPDEILQQADEIIAVWAENPEFSMGPEVTLERLKASRAELDRCITSVVATNRMLSKQIDEQDDCARIANQYAVRARKAIQAYFGPDSTQYAQVGGTRASDRRNASRRAKTPTVPKAA